MVEGVRWKVKGSNIWMWEKEKGKNGHCLNTKSHSHAQHNHSFFFGGEPFAFFTLKEIKSLFY